MVFEAVDTAILLLNALAVWILIGAALLTAALYALLAVLCLLGRAAARAATGAWRALDGHPEGVPAVDVATEAGPAPKPADRRVPAWADTEHREDQAA